MVDTKISKQPKRVPISEDLLTTPLDRLEEVRLKGTKCRSCGEVVLGKSTACQNCANQDMEAVVLGNKGKLYSYTVLRHRPPGDYKGPEPFVPFGLGLIELPDGLSVLAPLTGCDIDNLKIGMEFELLTEKLYQDEDGNDVMMFLFKPIQT
ncbi:Zn-ribbon domain-containing OB-fold protein [Chloroflexota bacterium]